MTSAIRASFRAGAAALALAAAPVALAGGGDGWYADFDEAAKAAKEQNKDLFVDFTGSDWCGWCIKLDNEVFSHEVWKEGVKDDYVLVALDYPSGDEAKAKVPNPERNEELKNEYGIRGFPTIMLMTADGEVYGQTGYKDGGPEKYLEHMAELRKNRARLFEVKKMAEEFTTLEGDAQWTAMGNILDVYDELGSGAPFRTQLREALRWGFANDADNAKGVRLRSAVALMEMGDDEHDYFGAIRDLDPKNEAGHLEAAVSKLFGSVSSDETARAALDALAMLDGLEVKDKEGYFEMLFNAARWSNGPLDDKEAARAYAKKAIEVGSDEEDQIKFLEEMLGDA